jgi:FkbM family methyltransferase
MGMWSKITGIFNSKGQGASEVLSTKYAGYDLFYSKGTSIVERFQKTGEYEQRTVDAIQSCIDSRNAQSFVDIGANVGLISLAILTKNPNIKIFAFEPGPHQYELFRKSIEYNHLQKNIELSGVALNETNGEAYFHIHNTQDASGDGFLDTGRAGKSKKIKVKTQKLDDWWRLNANPKIDFIKCDTEGAELFVLRGADDLVRHCKPFILLEIFHTNLQKYPYSALDIYDWLGERKYCIFTLTGLIVKRDELSELCKTESEFIAKPIL